MCARFTNTKKVKDIQDRFRPDSVQGEFKLPSNNIAPSQSAPVLYRKDDKRILAAFRFGLVPSWSKQEKIPYSLHNARIETIQEKPSYSRLLKSKRCLVLADGFFEWVATSSGRVPHRITSNSGDLFTFAAVFDEWKRPDGSSLQSFSIITMDSAQDTLMKPIHGRMPIVLSDALIEPWLSSDDHVELLEKIAKPYEPNTMVAYPVSTLVNSPRNDTPDCVKPIS